MGSMSIALESALRDFNGAFIIISHNLEFLKNIVVNKILEIKKDANQK